MALAQWAGQTVAAAAVTDVWESARRRFARLLDRGDARKTEVAERWLAETHEQLTAVEGADLEQARAAQAQRWEGRFADLLDEDPGAEADLRALVQEIQAAPPAGLVSATDHAVAAGRDVNISADRGSGNNRNGTTGKTVLTDIGAVDLAVPRDRRWVLAVPVLRLQCVRWLTSTYVVDRRSAPSCVDG
jgi:Transposase, Mutator family